MMKIPQLPHLQPRERLFAVIGGAALLVVLMDWVVLSPWARHGRAVRQETRQLEQALHAHQRLLARKDQVRAELEYYQRYLKPALADDLQMAALLQEIEGFANQSAVSVNEVKPLTVETTEAVKRYILEVRFDCTPEQWLDFAFRIESSPSLYEVTRATLALQEDLPDRLAGYFRIVNTASRGEANAALLSEGARHASAR